MTYVNTMTGNRARNVIVNVMAIAGLRSSSMPNIGSLMRFSTWMNATPDAAPRARKAIVRPEPQPHSSPLDRATRIRPAAAPSRSTPPRSKRRWTRTEDSGIRKITMGITTRL